MPDVTVLARTTALGLYERNFVIAGERCTDHLPLAKRTGVRERLWRIRPREVILATGAIERPLVFANNDLPGVMQADAALQYVRRYAVRSGGNALVFTNNDSAYATACELHSAGARVRIVDARQSAGEAASAQAQSAGIEVMQGQVIVSAVGGAQVQGARLMRYTDGVATGALSEVDCDLIAASGGWSPALHLHSHGGGKALYDDTQACFVPVDNPQGAVSVGGANGTFAIANALDSAYTAGSDAARRTVRRRKRGRAPVASSAYGTGPILPLWRVPVDPERRNLKAFVDYQNDTCASDLDLAVREGYESIEHVKRYTALGFGTDQGKLGNINGMGIVAENLGVSPAGVGTTTFRPPYTAVTFGAVAGADVGELFDPVRKTAIHEWHADNGARFEVVGQWLRPWYYPLPGEDMAAAVARECRAARGGVAMMDASTLGKIDVRGPDAAELLDRIYTNGWKKLEVGRARYGLMLGEDGMVMDDGVSARLADDHYYMTTTTGGAAHVYAWMERWLQTEWPDLKVYLTSITDQWATVAVAGPDARAVLERVGTDIDVSADAMPFMSFREGTVAGLPARVFRISFSGESAFEINVPADFGRALWEAVYAAGQPFGLTPYGTEAMHVLRAEKGFVIVGQDTDGSITPNDLGMDWIVAKHKDFLGKRSLARADCVRPERKQLVGLLADEPNTVIPEGAQLLREAYTRLPAPMEGHVTSSYHSGALGRSIALALLKGGRARHGERVYAATAGGGLIAARVTGPVFYDPKGERING
jgi:sarcosine oxidase subunit alpha